MSAGRGHGLIKQPELIRNRCHLNARLFNIIKKLKNNCHGYMPMCVWWYLMQRAHSKSLGSNRSLETFLQVFSLARCCMELLATPKIKNRQLVGQLIERDYRVGTIWKFLILMSSDLAFYTCYFLGQKQRVLCLKQTISSSVDCPSPGLPAEVQSKLFSGPHRHN